MKQWQQTLIGPDTTLRDALAAIDKAGCQIVLVVDAERRLLGTLSDGDARRALLRGLSLTDKVTDAMHRSPTTVMSGTPRDVQLATMRSRGIHQLPLVDASGLVVGLVTLDEVTATHRRTTPVVVMAGGLGSRLRDLTKDVPKPMLKVGSRPLLETLLVNFAEQGFRHFYFAVNYKADVIEQHFGDGHTFGVEVTYLRERQRLGSGGALSLLPQRPTEPFIVTNADLLMKEDFGRMVDQHTDVGADATIGVRDFEMQVPFGVIREKGGQVVGIDEKPVHRFQVSAGIYVLSPSMLELVPSEQYFDMPSLFDAELSAGRVLRSHRIDGYWIDVGRIADYERANADFEKVFV
jgi:dTDP-glucose pyrophosphorylase/predicted transcriptional regulator